MTTVVWRPICLTCASNVLDRQLLNTQTELSLDQIKYRHTKVSLSDRLKSILTPDIIANIGELRI